MSSLKEFTKNYFKNNGQYVFMSLLIAKICGFVSSIAIVRLITQKEFGTVTIVASVFAIFAAFNGFGSAQGLLRFGSLTEDGNEKQKLSDHFFYQGFIYQLILTLIFLISIKKNGRITAISISTTMVHSVVPSLYRSPCRKR
mgnify:CR=1 FL=1